MSAMERQRVTKAIVNTAWLSTAHNVHPALVPHAFLPMFGLPIVSLISWGFRWSWCIWPSDICTDGSVTPHCPSPSQPCSSNSLSTHTIPYLCTFWVHKFWLESDGKLALSAAFFPQEQAGLMCPFSHGLSKLNIVWLTQTQVGIIPIWKKWTNTSFCVCFYFFLWWPFLPRPKKSSSLLTGKLSLECCSEQSVSSMTDFCDLKMFFHNINLYHGLPPSPLKASGSLGVINGHPDCFGAILSLDDRWQGLVWIQVNGRFQEWMEDVWSAVEDTPLSVGATTIDGEHLW